MRTWDIKFSPFSALRAAAVLCALFCLAAPSLAGTGASGLEFLRITQSPRAVAMGESGVGMYGDVLAACQLNPAALGLTDYKEASAVYSSWIENLSMQQAAYAQPFAKGGVLAGSIALLQTGSIDGYDEYNSPTGSLSSSDKAFSLAYARRLFGPWDDKRFGLFGGAALKYASETLGPVSAGTTLYDIGLLSVNRRGDSVVDIGFSIQSLGKGLKFDSVQDKAPTVYSLGFGFITPLYGDPLSLAFDIKKPNDEKVYCSAGLEYLTKKMLAWRMGWVSASDLGSGLRFGVGFNLKFIQLDYALASLGKFGLTHRLSAAYKFGHPVEISPYLKPDQERAMRKLERGKKLMADGRYYEAMTELGEAIELDPALKEAVTLLRGARRQMETEKE
ncbi:MAG: PorV/PorQ family protein [Elusimicrobia bacterium]|nr:PorV/PorQ family protein [Elusimicrobiota bacterium]